jgi:hypothetical protein
MYIIDMRGTKRKSNRNKRRTQINRRRKKVKNHRKQGGGEKQTIVVFELDSGDAGFFAQFWSLCHAYIYAKNNKYPFFVNSSKWNYKSKDGWHDYFTSLNEYSDDGSPKDIKKSTHFERVSANVYKISDYIQTIKEIYILQEHILREIETRRKQYGLYNSIYIRRGDKSKENSIDPIEQVLEHTNLKESTKKLFVQADDYRAVKDVKGKLPSVEVVSITPEEKLGANAGEITKLDDNSRKLETENFLISIGIFLGGDECWTDIRSNVGRFHKLCEFKKVKYYPDNKDIDVNKESTPYDLAPPGKSPL